MKHLLACMAILAAFNVTAQVDGFQLPYNPDSEPDGYIGVGDVLEVLSIFGSEWNTSDIFLNDDSTHILLNVGDMTFPECVYTCTNTLPGSWRVASISDAGAAFGQLKVHEAWINDVDALNGNNQNAGFRRYRWASNGTVGSIDDFDITSGCFCATHQRPKVEYSYCEGGNIQNCANNKVADGWYPFGLSSHHQFPRSASIELEEQWKVQAFWRWAD